MTRLRQGIVFALLGALSFGLASPSRAQDQAAEDAETLRRTVVEKADNTKDDEIVLTLSKGEARLLNSALRDYSANRTFETSVITTKHLEAIEMAQMLQIFDAEIHPHTRNNMLIVKAPKNQIEAILDVVERLDVRPVEDAVANVELTVNLIQGSGSIGDASPSISDLPEYLGDVVTELGNVFQYGQYRLIDTLFLRCRDNSEVSTTGLLPEGSSQSQETTYHFSVDSVRVSEGDVRSVRLNDLSFSAILPMTQPNSAGAAPRTARVQQREMGIRADIDAREGQHVVVGKASLSSDDIALFVVVSAKVIDG